MNASLKTCFTVAAAVGLSFVFVASSWAQSYLDGSAKARGDYGQMPRISRNVSQPSFQAAAPVARSYSYEPAPVVKTDNANSSNGNEVKKAPSAAPNASANVQPSRRFSYEPGVGASNNAPARNATPLYLLPKTDSRKFGG